MANTPAGSGRLADRRGQPAAGSGRLAGGSGRLAAGGGRLADRCGRLAAGNGRLARPVPPTCRQERQGAPPSGAGRLPNPKP
ncbi:hypothetical protein [Amycolatopsis sp. NBC_01307]|uniref:hypothetical protein n=1 Tax=Amycolatopsis sp. NBC_01307 TaxID=2903561 RepID=UPI003FA3D64E